MDVRELKARLKADRPVYGTWSHLDHPTVVEIIGAAGLDFIVFDLEHGPHSFSDLPALYCAAERHGMVPVTRVPSGGNSNILRVLDSGSRGVMVPHGEGVEASARYLSAMRYDCGPGSRGVATLTRCSMFDYKNEKGHFERQNAQLMTVLMIEDRKALEELDDICRLPGLDAIFIGNYDLAQDLGMVCSYDDPEFGALYRDMVKRIRAHGIAVGGYAGTPQAVPLLLDMGVRFITLCVDGGVLRRAYEEFLTAVPGRE
jgi:2-keto-3-deoxy-L-rhamnonate aldolase RhmA